jgi:hypothetical protein
MFPQLFSIWIVPQLFSNSCPIYNAEKWHHTFFQFWLIQIHAVLYRMISSRPPLQECPIRASFVAICANYMNMSVIIKTIVFRQLSCATSSRPRCWLTTVYYCLRVLPLPAVPCTLVHRILDHGYGFHIGITQCFRDLNWQVEHTSSKTLSYDLTPWRFPPGRVFEHKAYTQSNQTVKLEMGLHHGLIDINLQHYQTLKCIGTYSLSYYEKIFFASVFFRHRMHFFATTDFLPSFS